MLRFVVSIFVNQISESLYNTTHNCWTLHALDQKKKSFKPAEISIGDDCYVWHKVRGFNYASDLWQKPNGVFPLTVSFTYYYCEFSISEKFNICFLNLHLFVHDYRNDYLTVQQLARLIDLAIAKPVSAAVDSNWGGDGSSMVSVGGGSQNGSSGYLSNGGGNSNRGMSDMLGHGWVRRHDRGSGDLGHRGSNGGMAVSEAVGGGSYSGVAVPDSIDGSGDSSATVSKAIGGSGDASSVSSSYGEGDDGELL